MEMCNRECEHNLICPYEDCINDNISTEEYQRSKTLDNELKASQLDKHQLARKLANKRYRDKHRDILMVKDRERYHGKRKDDVVSNSKKYNQEHREEINVASLMNYYKKKVS